MKLLHSRVTRRRFIEAGAVTAGAVAVGAALRGSSPEPSLHSGLQLTEASGPLEGPGQSTSAVGPGQAPCSDGVADLKHLAWVWQFSRDGDPYAIGADLARYNMAVAVKTHDATDWMSTYDQSASAISGSEQVTNLAGQFENAGVSFHAWCVIKGLEPTAEAMMAAQVLESGARSLILDLEAGHGFYQGDSAAALQFGRTLRTLQPDATVYLSIDPRPWRLGLVPLNEFAAFSDGFLPQLYWESFNSSGNIAGYQAAGYPAVELGITPELLLDSAHDILKPYGIPIMPVGQGDSLNTEYWRRFIDHSRTLGMPQMSVWRYGVANPEVWPLLGPDIDVTASS